MSDFSRHSFSKLIGSIYDCALNPAQWDETLSLLVRALGCEKAILSLNDLRHNRALIEKSVGWDPHWLAERTKHVPEIHAALTAWFAQHSSLDEPFVSSRYISPEYAAKSAYVRQCLRPQGIVDIAHFFLLREPSHFSELVLARHERQGAITEREVELGALLLPHLRRAVTISNVLDVGVIERARMTEAINALRCGVILTNGQGAILHLNRSAEALVSNDGPFECVRGVLQARLPSARNELQKALSLAARDEAGIGDAGIAIRLTEPGAPPVFAHVLPMIGGELRTRLRPDAAAAVFIGLPPQAWDGAHLLGQAFGLTRAETNVVASLLAGRNLTETAADLRVASSTVKTHLDRVFSKTGASRQSELIRLAMQLMPPARP